MTRIQTLELSARSWRLIRASWLLLAVVASAPAALAQVAPSPGLSEAFARGGYDESQTLARREAESCLKVPTNVATGACLGLLVIASDSTAEWERQHGDIAQTTEIAARALIDRAAQAEDPDPTAAMTAHRNLGYTLTNRGRLIEGEQHLRMWLGEALRVISSTPPAGRLELTASAGFRRGFELLAANLAEQRRYAAAAAYFKVADAMISANPETVTPLEAADMVLTAAAIPDAQHAGAALLPGRTNLQAATAYLARAEGRAKSARTPARVQDQLKALRGVLLSRQGRSAEALAAFGAQKVFAGEGTRGAIFNLVRAHTLTAAARHAEAAIAIQEALTALQQTSADNGLRIEALTAAGLNALRLNNVETDSFQTLRQAAAGAVARAEQTADPSEAARLLRHYGPAFSGLMLANWITGPAAGASDASLKRDEAFVAAQWATASETAVSLAKTNARRAGQAASAIAELEARRSSLVEAQLAADLSIVALANIARADVARIQGSAFGEASSEIRALGDQIATIDPAYADLTRPKPLPRVEAQALLGADEAMLMIVPSEDRTTIFALTRDGATWSQARGLGSNQLADKVSKLRQQIQSDLDGSARGLERKEQQWTAFDPALANELYRALIRPVEGILRQANTVMVVGSGAITSLPMQLLVTELPANGPPSYLIDRYAFTTLPSVGSLRALRCLRPDVEPHPGCGSRATARERTRAPGPILAAVGAPTLRGAPSFNRGPTAYPAAMKAGVANTDYLRALPYLPGTRVEIESLKARFADRPVVARLGDEAREAYVRTSGEVASARFVLLSTHGLLAGESGGLGEPGLVFTPPAAAQASPADDGLLTASEAAAMQLAADLLVLSACNTAGPDGRAGAEGLSGLARGFLYAGAQALLVSHWSVSDEASARLIGDTLSRADGAPNRALALKQAALDIRAQPRWASPAYWAPFVVVGVPE